METNKGFTLIELLAVIVILAIIALIAVPIVLRVIETAEKGAAKASALGYIDAVEKQILINEMDDNTTNDIVDGDYTINGDNIVKGSTSIEVKVKGKPVTGSFTISNGEVTTVDLEVGKYTVGGNAKNNTIEVTSGGSSGNNFVGSSSLEAGLPIGQDVYINPATKLTCNSYTEEASITGNKTGCMKWYVYKDNGNGTYQLILDHNTTATVAWNSSGSNASMNEIATALTSDTSTWDSSLGARLITAEEVAAITGNTTFSVATSISSKYFYFDTNTTSPSTTCKSGNTTGCQYGWLYDRTRTNCEDYGCLNNSDVSTYGYWTKSPVSGNSYHVWRVYYYGALDYSNALGTIYGVRPVITF